MQDQRNSNIHPNHQWAGNHAGTMDWYLVESPKGKEIAVRQIDLNGRVPLAGPYETKSQAMCERLGNVEYWKTA
jgi:hypothetical protein